MIFFLLINSNKPTWKTQNQRILISLRSFKNKMVAEFPEAKSSDLFLAIHWTDLVWNWNGMLQYRYFESFSANTSVTEGVTYRKFLLLLHGSGVVTRKWTNKIIRYRQMTSFSNKGLVYMEPNTMNQKLIYFLNLVFQRPYCFTLFNFDHLRQRTDR